MLGKTSGRGKTGILTGIHLGSNAQPGGQARPIAAADTQNGPFKTALKTFHPLVGAIPAPY
jgi:hypothetical protein